MNSRGGTVNIGIACSSFRQSGGLERYALDLVGGLNRLGMRPTVLARSFDAELLRQFDIAPCRIGTSLLPGKLRGPYFSHRVTTLKQQLGLDALIGVNRTLGSDIAICGGTHRGYLRASGKRPTWSDNWQIRLEGAQYDQACKVVAHSRLMAEELIELYEVPAHKIALLYPPVDLSRFTPVDASARAALRERLGLPADKVVFLFPSSSHARKGYAQLAAFFEQTPLPVMLAVAGRPVASTSDAIRYIGYQANMADAYAAADYSILASRYEPFGLVGVESLLCGTPVVLDRRIACTEVLAAPACVTFDSMRPADLARVIGDCVAACAAGSHLLPPTARNGRDASTLRHAIGYDPDVDRHVAALLALLPASTLPPLPPDWTPGETEGRAGDAASAMRPSAA